MKGYFLEQYGRLANIIVVIIAVPVFFYLLFPKYHFFREGRIRCNKITGRVEYFLNRDSGWIDCKRTSEKDVGFVSEEKTESTE